MSEELGTIEETTVDPVEEKAREMGWVPEDEYEGDTDKWVDAKEFVGRAPLYEGLSKANKRMKRMQEAIDNLVKHNSEIMKATKERQIEDLEDERQRAEEEGDTARARKIDKDIDKVNQMEVPEGPSPAFQAFVEENEWYIDNPDLAAIADRKGMFLAQQGKEEQEVLDEVAKYINENYLNKTHTRRSSAPPTSEGGNKRKASSKSNRKDRLNDAQKAAMNNFVRLGVLTEDEYIEQLEEAGLLEA